MLILITIVFSVSIQIFRYYRANSVRYPNGPCEGMCAHNHFCAITRVDYDEYRHCRESAASALATGGANVRAPLPSLTHITLLLAVYTIIKRHPRQLLFGWLHYAWLVVVTVIAYANTTIWTMLKWLGKWGSTWDGYHWTMSLKEQLCVALSLTTTTQTTAIVSSPSSPLSSSSLNHANHLINNSINHKSNWLQFMCTQFWSNFIACVTLIRYYTFDCHTIRSFYRMSNVTVGGRHADNDVNEHNDYEPIEIDSSDVQSSKLTVQHLNAEHNCNGEERVVCQNQTLVGSFNAIGRIFSHRERSVDRFGTLAPEMMADAGVQCRTARHLKV